jgi:arginine deiminase
MLNIYLIIILNIRDKVDKYYDRYLPHHIEGGDVLNLNDHVLAIGISQRTMAEAIDQIAKNLFADLDCKIDTILAFSIPNSRAFMHLDTVFTQIDYDKFTYHPGIMDTLQVFEITEGDVPTYI